MPVWTMLITPGKYFGFCIATQMFEHVTIAWFGIGANLEGEAHDFHPQFSASWNLEHLGRRWRFLATKEKNERLAGAPVIIGRVKKCLRLFLSGPLTVKACERTDIYEILIFNLIFAFRFGYHMAIRYTYLAAGLPCFRVLKIWYNLTLESDFILFASWLCVSVEATHIWHLIYHVLRFLQI